MTETLAYGYSFEGAVRKLAVTWDSALVFAEYSLSLLYLIHILASPVSRGLLSRYTICPIPNPNDWYTCKYVYFPFFIMFFCLIYNFVSV